mmetsp:Transcript_71525/g.118902  ORF Transcript_71525/g.118902 Transcript_71525/m.118902 type:complete len:208 (+) Transcript_71525:2569-3192(+)
MDLVETQDELAQRFQRIEPLNLSDAIAMQVKTLKLVERHPLCLQKLLCNSIHFGSLSQWRRHVECRSTHIVVRVCSGGKCALLRKSKQWARQVGEVDRLCLGLHLSAKAPTKFQELSRRRLALGRRITHVVLELDKILGQNERRLKDKPSALLAVIARDPIHGGEAIVVARDERRLLPSLLASSGLGLFLCASRKEYLGNQQPSAHH